MTPRRLLLLIATLLIVQLGGLLHGLTHVGEDDHEHGGEPHAACEWCLAYAALDHGLTGLPPTPAGAAAPTPAARIASYPAGIGAQLPYRSRAPPARLA